MEGGRKGELEGFWAFLYPFFVSKKEKKRKGDGGGGRKGWLKRAGACRQ